MRSVRVTPRARTRPDRAGDPLDGLVNLFDLGIVLSVAFLLAALSSLKLSDILTNEKVEVIRNTSKGQEIITRQGQKVTRIQLQPGQRVVGRGDRIGSVYRLSDGRIVYVQDGAAPPAGATPAPGAGGTGGSGGTTTQTTPPPSGGATTPTTPGTTPKPTTPGTTTPGTTPKPTP
ncbi:MAG: hypothetical protein QOJ12_2742 [Thermoleophilales bacterium]|nr:hypothetical protein [Thermoleophilales bacterium]